MLILLHLDPVDRLAAKAYRLQVKERIFRFNYVRLASSVRDRTLLIFDTGGLGTT
jgi:hypothetical protein